MASSVSCSGNYSSFHGISGLEVRSVQGKEKVGPHLEPCPYPFLSWLQISIPYCRVLETPSLLSLSTHFVAGLE